MYTRILNEWVKKQKISTMATVKPYFIICLYMKIIPDLVWIEVSTI